MVTITVDPASAAYAAASELKRLYTAQTWGEVEVRRVGERVEMLLPPHTWRDAQLRQIDRRFGGVQTG